MGFLIESILRERFTVRYLRFVTDLLTRPQFVPEIFEMNRLYFSRGGRGPLAFDRTIACCEAEVFRPKVMQEAPQWPTAVRLVAAGSGSIFSSRLRRKFRNAWSRLQDGPFSTFDID
jgi:hypothetical protein